MNMLGIEAGTVIAPMLDASRACIARLKEVCRLRSRSSAALATTHHPAQVV